MSEGCVKCSHRRIHVAKYDGVHRSSCHAHVQWRQPVINFEKTTIVPFITPRLLPNFLPSPRPIPLQSPLRLLAVHSPACPFPLRLLKGYNPRKHLTNNIFRPENQLGFLGTLLCQEMEAVTRQLQRCACWAAFYCSATACRKWTPYTDCDSASITGHRALQLITLDILIIKRTQQTVFRSFQQFVESVICKLESCRSIATLRSTLRASTIITGFDVILIMGDDIGISVI